MERHILPSKLALSIVAGIDVALGTTPALEESVRQRYVHQTDLRSMIEGNSNGIESSIIKQSISSLQVEEGVDRWKIAFEEMLKIVSQDTLPTVKCSTRIGSNQVCASPPKSAKKADTTLSGRAKPVHPARRTKLVPAEDDFKQLHQLLLSRKPLYKNAYHRHMKCTAKDCEFCKQLFIHTEVTPCAKFSDHTICHPTGFYPHVGLHLWKQVKVSHDANLAYRTSMVRKLRRTVMDRVIDPDYNRKIDEYLREIAKTFGASQSDTQDHGHSEASQEYTPVSPAYQVESD